MQCFSQWSTVSVTPHTQTCHKLSIVEPRDAVENKITASTTALARMMSCCVQYVAGKTN